MPLSWLLYAFQIPVMSLLIVLECVGVFMTCERCLMEN